MTDSDSRSSRIKALWPRKDKAERLKKDKALRPGQNKDAK